MNKIDVTYLFRKKGHKFSIEKVFSAVIGGFRARQIDVRCVEVPCGTASPWSLLCNLLYCWRLRKRLVHITGDIHYCALALRRSKYIITIHDMVLLERKNKLSHFIFLWLWYKLPIRRAGCVTCISEKTKEQIIKFCGPLTIPVHVIPNPIDMRFRFFPKNFNCLRPVILHVGTKENKNLFRVVEAIKNIRCALRIIGRLTPRQREILDASSIQYSSCHDISDGQIIEEYKRADIVCFPSLFEGFGMPIIEAQATGRVVVTSNISPMTDVAGEAACFVDPHDVDSIRNGISRVICDRAYREKLIYAGVKNVQRYSSKMVARRYLKIYGELRDRN